MRIHWIKTSRLVLILCATLVLLATTGCGLIKSGVDNSLNPYTDVPDNAYGTRDLGAITGGGTSSKADRARHALNVMSQYQRAHAPSPVAPVRHPAVV